MLKSIRKLFKRKQRRFVWFGWERDVYRVSILRSKEEVVQLKRFTQSLDAFLGAVDKRFSVNDRRSFLWWIRCYIVSLDESYLNKASDIVVRYIKSYNDDDLAMLLTMIKRS